MTELFRNRIADKKSALPGIIAAAALVALQGCGGGSQLKPWHTEKLDEEFTENKADQVRTFDDYLELENRLFQQLDEKVYAQTGTGLEYKLDRYSSGSAADPRKGEPDWNRSFEFSTENPRGGVLLIHGMSDSPYSLRTLGKALNRNGYWVVGMRMPGHGTAPSGLRHISRHDMAAAVRIGMTHLGDRVGGKPVHMVGYSTGAPLALEFALDALNGKSSPVPGSLVLVSPAIGIHPIAGIASFKDWLSNIPGLSGLAYTQIQPEFDPYKYNSFATNAARVVHGLTRSVATRIEQRAATNPDIVLPPVLVFKSTVDATVSTNAVVDNLLEHLHEDRHELVLFDINRYAASYRLLVDDPAPLTDRVMDNDKLPFTVSLVTNKTPDSRHVISKYKTPFSAEASHKRELESSWPAGVISLSHVALPFAPDDPLYGQRPPNKEEFLFLGQLGIQGERGLLTIPSLDVPSALQPVLRLYRKTHTGLGRKGWQEGQVICLPVFVRTTSLHQSAMNLNGKHHYLPLIYLWACLASITVHAEDIPEQTSKTVGKSSEKYLVTDEVRDRELGAEEDPMARQQSEYIETPEEVITQPDELRPYGSLRIRYRDTDAGSFWGDGGSRFGLYGRW